MRGRERREAPDRLRELALRPDLTSAAGLVPRDRDVHEALEEVAFRARRGAPGELELLVRGEVLAGADERYAVAETGLGLLCVGRRER